MQRSVHFGNLVDVMCLPSNNKNGATVVTMSDECVNVLPGVGQLVKISFFYILKTVFNFLEYHMKLTILLDIQI